MELSYIKLYHDFLEEVSLLTNQEIGALVRAMLLYSRGEPIPEGLLAGSAQILFPRWQLQIDRDRAAYVKRCETNRQNALKRCAHQSPEDNPSPPVPRPRQPTLPASNPALNYAQRENVDYSNCFIDPSRLYPTTSGRNATKAPQTLSESAQ